MVILEPNLIARKYIKSWSVISSSFQNGFTTFTFTFRFVLDLISTIPVDYIFLVLDSGLLKTDTV